MTIPTPASLPPAGATEGRTDRAWALGVILSFTLSLGIGPLALPLVALAAGYDAAAIGLLTATAAISQFGFRLALPWLLGRFPDRWIIAVSCLLLSGSYAVLLVSTIPPVFVVAELLLGGSRALFWTASQTHAVRTRGAPVRMLAQVGVVGNVGTMIGPLLTGFVALQSVDIALVIAAALGLLGFVIALRLDHFDPYQRRRRRGEKRLWRRKGVDVPCWAGFAAGGWRALTSSYVPVVLDASGMPSNVIGLLLSGADLASLLAIEALSRVSPARLRLGIDIAVVVMAVGLAILPFVAGHTVLASIALIASGAGSGPPSILGGAVARTMVDPADEGEALALVGTFRAAAMLVTPSGVALALAVVSVPVGMALAAVATSLPATLLTIRHRRST